MKARTPSRITFLIPAVVCLAVTLVMGLQLSRQMREDLYWTPVGEAPTLQQARPQAEILVGDELLQEQVDAGRLTLDGRPLEADALRIRFNNVDSVTRAQTIILAAAGGAGVAFLAAAFLLPRQRRRETPADDLLETPR
jgi:DNA-binding transcriptional LysR family regulator